MNIFIAVLCKSYEQHDALVESKFRLARVRTVFDKTATFAGLRTLRTCRWGVPPVDHSASGGQFQCKAEDCKPGQPCDKCQEQEHQYRKAARYIWYTKAKCDQDYDGGDDETEAPSEGFPLVAEMTAP